jgi:hypothetical protein
MVPFDQLSPHLKVAKIHWIMSWLCAAVGIVTVALAFREGTVHVMDLLAPGFLRLSEVSLVFVALNRWLWRANTDARGWARHISRICAVLMLPLFPLWTMFGVYILLYSRKPWAQGGPA